MGNFFIPQPEGEPAVTLAEKPDALIEPPIKRVSFSLVKRFEKCPYEVYQGRVLRLPEPDRDEKHPLVRGDRIHKEAEAYIKGKGSITKDLQKVQTILTELRALYQTSTLEYNLVVEVEGEWGFTKDWKPCGWHDKENWVYVKLDVLVKYMNGYARIIDWKTGKSFGKEVNHGQQMQFYAIAAFLRYPELTLIDVELVYTDEGKSKKKQYTRAQAEELFHRWVPRLNNVITATSFPPKANKMNCRFCSFGTVNGTGACVYAVDS